MNRKIIGLLIVLDLAFLGVVGVRLWNRTLVLQGELAAPSEPSAAGVPTTTPPETVPPPAEAPETPPASPPEQVTSTTTLVVSASTPSETEKKHRRTFVYNGRKAKSVEVVGDFNGWTPDSLVKDAKGRWKIVVELAPGDYSYNFVVDGKVVRDPNQRRTDEKGRSLLTVPS